MLSLIIPYRVTKIVSENFDMLDKPIINLYNGCRNYKGGGIMSKRNNGDGCIFQSSNGEWRASIQIGKDANGKPIRKQFSAWTEREVKSKLAKFKKERGVYTPSQLTQITISEFSTQWLNYKKTHLKPRSYQRLVSTINSY